MGPHVDFGRDGRAGEETGALSGVEGHQTRQLKKELPAPPPSPPDFFELDQSLKMSRGKRGGPREQGSQAEEEEEGILLPQVGSLASFSVGTSAFASLASRPSARHGGLGRKTSRHYQAVLR